ncbi:MAG: ornithine-acyl-ACP acyltransferase [Rhodobacterales bacterium]|nr:MAG: ornithine-acyl-ACP acyltransferase [Rhodobacterales bacterium]
MAPRKPEFELRLARDDTDMRACQRLRYDIFVEELGGDGPLVDHANRLERDALDDSYDHLLLIDKAVPGAPVVGVYRLMRGERLAPGQEFYSAREYDLAPLVASGRRLLELGRSCVHRDYRGGPALMTLWQGLLAYVERHEVEVLFGVASFHGTDPEALAPALSLLHYRYLAPPELRAKARADRAQRMDLLPESAIDRAAMRGVPPLIKSYLRLGGWVGEDAWVDREFNTTDVCIVVDITLVPERIRAAYAGGAMP